MEEEKHSINLLRGHKEAFKEKFVRWALTVGRLLVIVTETIALGVFVYRFSLDQQLVDLHDQIKQEQIIVSHLKKNEAEFRNFQERLALAKKFDNESSQLATRYNNLSKLTAGDVQLSSVLMTEDVIRVDAVTRSITSLSRFINALKTFPQVSAVTVEKVENKTSTALINISISLSFADKGGKPDEAK